MELKSIIEDFLTYVPYYISDNEIEALDEMLIEWRDMPEDGFGPFDTEIAGQHIAVRMI